MPTKTKPPVVEVPLPPEWVDEPEPEFETAVTTAKTIEAVYAEAEDDRVIRAIVPVEHAGPTSNSVIVGLGALASMSDEEYEAKKSVMQRGLARVIDLQQSLMQNGQDYGRVPGISKPFLQLPGAEKLANFYGYAVRQESERIVRGPDEGPEVPALTYRTRAYVHLGSFDGPIVGMGDGEANSHEDKYRWRWEYPKCEKCGHELMKGKPDSAMAGKMYCPGFKGGCWAKYEIGQVKPAQKVENPDPHGLAETLLQISAKRAFVASIRRATGTSGLFSMDDDSPSVQAQAAESAPSDNSITSEAAPIGIQVGVGAKTSEATQVQHNQLARLAKEKGLGAVQIADLLNRLFGLDVEPTGKAATAAVRGLDAAQMGRLLQSLDTGEVPEAPEQRKDRIANEPEMGFPPQQSDEM